MADLSARILAEVGRKGYRPLKLKQLAKKLGIIGDDYSTFRHTVKDLVLPRGRAGAKALAAAKKK